MESMRRDNNGVIQIFIGVQGEILDVLFSAEIGSEGSPPRGGRVTLFTCT